MIVVEYSPEDYGKVMKYVACIKKKAEELEEIFSDSTMNHRGHHHEDDEDDEYDRDVRFRWKNRNRYM